MNGGCHGSIRRGEASAKKLGAAVRQAAAEETKQGDSKGYFLS